MPTYYIIRGWVVAAANPLYGAILLGVYGLGRVLPAVGLGALIVAGRSPLSPLSVTCYRVARPEPAWNLE